MDIGTAVVIGLIACFMLGCLCNRKPKVDIGFAPVHNPKGGRQYRK